MARPKKAPAEKVITFGVSVLPDDGDAITQEAKSRRITPASFAGALMMRGWKEYLEDGQLDDVISNDVLHYRKQPSSLTEPEVDVD